jgi:hypothetical protein
MGFSSWTIIPMILAIGQQRRLERFRCPLRIHTAPFGRHCHRLRRLVRQADQAALQTAGIPYTPAVVADEAVLRRATSTVLTASVRPLHPRGVSEVAVSGQPTARVVHAPACACAAVCEAEVDGQGVVVRCGWDGCGRDRGLDWVSVRRRLVV